VTEQRHELMLQERNSKKSPNWEAIWRTHRIKSGSWRIVITRWVTR